MQAYYRNNDRTSHRTDQTAKDRKEGGASPIKISAPPCLFFDRKRLLQRDLREKLTVHERRRHFNIDDLEGSRHIDILRRTAANRSKWRRGVEAIVAKEQARWIKRNTEKSRKRAAEKVTYERRRREAEARKRQRTTVADGSKKRTIDQYFFR